MLRQMIRIDSKLCNGCGLCVKSCAEGAIGLVEGKARVLREDTCDGLGACLPVCPTGALTLQEQDVPAFSDPHPLDHAPNPQKKNWPLQLQLSPLTSDAYAGKHLLVAADCTAFASPLAYASLSDGKPVLIFCPKFDKSNIVGRLGSILKSNDFTALSVLRMEVPCCSGLEKAVREALVSSQKDLEITVRILHKDGRLA
jgi:NAD-dependent dihydropyrimidine dehydrogenase PreA subunit